MRTRLLLVVAVVAVVALGSVLVARQLGPSGFGCTFSRDACLRVLFVGNSYTSVNDLPGEFARLVRAGGGSVEVASVTPGGARLADHIADPTVPGLIAAGSGGVPWTAVVLQEQSQLPAIDAAYEAQTVPAAVGLANAARAAGSTPYLYETWPHRDGWPEAGLTRDAMGAALARSYRDLGARTGSFVAPVGEAWMRAIAQAPAIALWADDGSHPSPAGTYLAACVLYATITGRSPVGLSETGGLPAADAATLQRIAAAP